MEYILEGKSVTEEVFQTFRKTLIEIEDTYHCAKTIGGGRNSYEAKDSNGVVWICRSVSNGDKETYSIERH